jgi:hypothetical protein
MVFHRCVITVIAVLAVGTSATAGPIKLGETGPPLDVRELRANGVLDKDVLRALFFRGVNGRSAPNSCSDCLNSNSSLTPRDRDEHSNYRTLFPFSSRNVYKAPSKPGAAAPGRSAQPDRVTGVADVTGAVTGGQPVSSGEGVAQGAPEATAAVPEPATLMLLGSGLAGAWIVRRRRGRGPRSN